MYLPKYNGDCIVNLMSSIATAFDGRTPYNQLKILTPEEIRKYRNVVLMVIDGLGYNYLKKMDGSFLKESLRGSMTSVFLPTTASAVTTFLTGVAPQQHAFTGWYVYLKEIGVVSKILPFSPRIGGCSFSNFGFNIKEILNQEPLTKRIKAECWSISHFDLLNSDFTKYTFQKSKQLSYKNLNGFFKCLKKAIKTGDHKKYIYAYWPEMDSLNHKFGVESKRSNKHFKILDKEIKKFSKELKGTKTLLIVTADHGFINTPGEKIIKLEDHPKLKDCLVLPLCGEGRTAYCYVKPFRTKEFEEYIKTYFKKYCYIFRSEYLIKKNFFGLGPPNPKLFDRVGDYTLILKENYIIKDKIKEEKKDPHVGHHGGVSSDEMLVPLIIAE